MTKRISQANTVVVPAVETHGVDAKVDAVKAVAAVADADKVADKVDVVVAKDEAAPVAAEAVVALVAPVAMVAEQAQDTTTTTTSTTTTDASTTSSDGSTGTDYTPYIVGGVLLAGGIAAIALSGDDNNNSSPTPSPTPTPTPTNTAPSFSASTATASVAENTAATTTVFTAAATDAQGNTITYSLGGTDASLFNINSSTGVVTLKNSANFEAKSSYSFTVTATDNASTPLSSTQTVTLNVTNVNEAPTFSTASVTTSFAENTATTTALTGLGTATDPDASTTLTYSLSGTDASFFNVNSSTGAVTFKASPDFESTSHSPTYSFNLVASDGSLTASQAVTVNVTNVNEAPAFASGTVAVSIAENTPTTTALSLGTATDPDANTTLTYSLSGTDASFFNVNSSTGAVTFKSSPDFEASRSPIYSFNLVATDSAGLSATRAATVTVTDVAEGGSGFPAATASLDQGSATAVTINAGSNAYTFNETASGQSNVVITNFGTDDRIVVTGVNGSTTATSYSFSSIGSDLQISFNNAGTVSQITLTGVVSPNAFIYNEATAEAAVGAQLGVSGGTLDFFRYG